MAVWKICMVRASSLVLSFRELLRYFFRVDGLTPNRSRVAFGMPIQDLAQSTLESLKKTDTKTLRNLSDGCFLAGFASIAASIAIWAAKRADNETAHAERFGIFVGLWAPTFFILSNRFERYAERVEEGKTDNLPV